METSEKEQMENKVAETETEEEHEEECCCYCCGYSSKPKLTYVVTGKHRWSHLTPSKKQAHNK